MDFLRPQTSVCHHDDRRKSSMSSNLLHVINMTKSDYMHFRPKMNPVKRQTCARNRIEKFLKLAVNTLKKMTKAKFLGVIIDDQLTWNTLIHARFLSPRKAELPQNFKCILLGKMCSRLFKYPFYLLSWRESFHLTPS